MKLAGLIAGAVLVLAAGFGAGYAAHHPPAPMQSCRSAVHDVNPAVTAPQLAAICG